MDGFCGKEGVDLFALVAYLPEPLAGLVDAVRHEISPGCRLRAHVTVLPPREFGCAPAAVSREIQRVLGQTRSFQVSVGGIKVFPGSEVIHLEIGAGLEQIRELHTELDQGLCRAPELWPFQPHITLAQGLEPAAVGPAYELAVRRWREYSGPRSFALDHLTFVRRTLENGKGKSEDGAAQNPWVDLATWELPSPVLA